jgi:hypothetical protein
MRVRPGTLEVVLAVVLVCAYILWNVSHVRGKSMNLDGMPESKNIADRRGKKKPETLAEIIEANQQEPQPERGQPYSDSDLAKRLGVGDVGA